MQKKGEKIGEYLIRMEELSFEQAELILKKQKRSPKKKFGQIAVELGFIGYDALKAILRTGVSDT